MFVVEFKEDLKLALGTCEDDEAYRRLSDAVRLLEKSQLFDTSVGDISVCVCGNFVTLPAEVETPLGVSVNGNPALIRNQWFAYHINGTGDVSWTPFGFADVLGSQFCTIRDPDRAVRLVARINTITDQNKKLRVFGWAEDGSRIMSLNARGEKEDGFFVPLVYGKTLFNTDVPPIKVIERVYKEVSSDLVELFAVDPTTMETVSLLGSYRPRETVPQYTRIKVAARNVVRVKFRRRSFELRDDYDWIPLENRLALIHGLRSVKFGMDGKSALADDAEVRALRYLRNDQNSRKPGGIAPPQVINNELPRASAGSSLFYGNRPR